MNEATNNTNNMPSNGQPKTRKINRKQALAAIERCKQDIVRINSVISKLEKQLLSLRGPGRPIGWRKPVENPATPEQLAQIERLLVVAKNIAEKNPKAQRVVNFIVRYMMRGSKSFLGAQSVIENTQKRLNNLR